MASPSPIKERTPASDTTSSEAAAAAPGGITFTPKEEVVLKVAWSCFKGGAPEIDIAKLTELCDFKTAKTAINTWGVIKKKLVAIGEAKGDGATVDAPATPKTPKAKAIPKKRTKKSDDGDEEGAAAKDDAAPKKKRKSPVKKNVKEDSPVAAVEEEEAVVKGEEMEE